MKFFVALLALSMIYLGATGRYREVWLVLTGNTLPEKNSLLGNASGNGRGVTSPIRAGGNIGTG